MREWLAKKIAGPHWPVALPAVIAPSTPPAPWYPSVLKRELRLGEVITGLVNYRYRAVTDGLELQGIVNSYVIVGTPECDLLQSFRDMNAGKALKISGVLFFEAENADVARKRIPGGSKVWSEVVKHKFEGFHHLTDFTPQCDLHGEQLPNLVIDFKRYFTLPLDEVCRQLDATDPERPKRRCYPGDTWREQIQQRAQASMGRVGTPDPSDTA